MTPKSCPLTPQRLWYIHACAHTGPIIGGDTAQSRGHLRNTGEAVVQPPAPKKIALFLFPIFSLYLLLSGLFLLRVWAISKCQQLLPFSL